MLQTDYFETSHADLLLAAVIGEAPKPKSKLRHIDYVGDLRMPEAMHAAVMREAKWRCMGCGHDTTSTCPRCTVQQIVLQESDPIAEVYNDISGMVKQLLTTQPQPEAAELCPICLITPLVGSDCPRCGDDCEFLLTLVRS
jgi:hypothetical protein